MTPRTMFDKLWDSHLIEPGVRGGADLIYVDLQFLHEASSPQAFSMLESFGLSVRRPHQQFGTEDHHIPTDGENLAKFTVQPTQQALALRKAAELHGIAHAPVGHVDQGIVHVIGPELGLSQPGMTIVCGDSHTSTHGALGALAFGIGTSEVAHVLATQTLWVQRPKTMRILVENHIEEGVTAKDLALHLMATLGPGGGQGYVIEYAGEAVESLTIEERMTLCNMSIEAGARAGLVAPDDATVEYIRGRRYAPPPATYDITSREWMLLRTDLGAQFEVEHLLDGAAVMPRVTWGTNPSQSVAIDEPVPELTTLPRAARDSAAKAMDYMGIHPGQDMRTLDVDAVFVGSCTNGRLDDIRSVARVLEGRRVKTGVRMVVTPGSSAVKRQAESEGLHTTITQAGAEWRSAGCSLCIHAPYEQTPPGTRIASTSNRNFMGRQGPSTRTHLVSPAVAAATAVCGRFTHPSSL